jgi:hypothetical protein
MDEISDGIAIIPGATAPVADNRYFQNGCHVHHCTIVAL